MNISPSRAGVVALLILVLMRWLLVEIYLVPSVSMFPAIFPNDVILVDKLAFGVRVPFSEKWIYRRDNLKAGDVAVFKAPEEQGGDVLVKRTIGFPGDKIQVSTAGMMSLNDKSLTYSRLDKPFDLAGAGFGDERLQFFTETHNGIERVIALVRGTGRVFAKPFSVPAGHYFFMGDNRDYSVDSRYWGAVHPQSLIGRPIVVLWNCRHPDPIVGLFCWPWDMRAERSGTLVR